MVIEEQTGNKPLFNYRYFTKDGTPLNSLDIDETLANQHQTGIRKILEVMKIVKEKKFPTQELFKVYFQHPLPSFTIKIRGMKNGKELKEWIDQNVLAIFYEAFKAQAKKRSV